MRLMRHAQCPDIPFYAEQKWSGVARAEFGVRKEMHNA